MSHKISLLIASAVVLSLSLTSCSAPETLDSDTAETDTGPEAQEVVSVAAPVADLGSRLAVGQYNGYTGVEGYTFDLTLTVAADKSESSVTNAAPGFTDFIWMGEGVYLATNTTDQRASNLVKIGAELSAYWPETSALCQAGIQTPMGKEIFSLRKIESDGVKWCTPTPTALATADNPMAVGQTLPATLNFSYSFTAEEQYAAGIQADLDSGPSFWAMSSALKTASPDECDTSGVFWVSDPSVGCSGPGSVSLDVPEGAIAVDAALAATREVAGGAGEVCNFSITPRDLAPGMMSGSLQTLEWDGWSIDDPSESNDIPEEFAETKGFTCTDGGNQLAAIDLESVSDTRSYLANDLYQEWDTVSEPVPMRGGEAMFSEAVISPASGGEEYPVVKFAWRSGDLLIKGRLVRADVDLAAAWLNRHLPAVVDSVFAE